MSLQDYCSPGRLLYIIKQKVKREGEREREGVKREREGRGRRGRGRGKGTENSKSGKTDLCHACSFREGLLLMSKCNNWPQSGPTLVTMDNKKIAIKVSGSVKNGLHALFLAHY